MTTCQASGLSQGQGAKRKAASTRKSPGGGKQRPSNARYSAKAPNRIRKQPPGEHMNGSADERAQKLARTAARRMSRAEFEIETPADGSIQSFSDRAAQIMEEVSHPDDSEPANSRRGRGRGAKKTLQHSLLQAHKEAMQAAMKAELAEEWTAAEDRLNKWSKARLQEEGLALFGLVAEPAGLLFRDAIIRLAMPVRGTVLPYHQFSQGDIVLLTGPASCDGVIMDCATRWVRVAVPESAAASMARGPWRVDQAINITAHTRCMEAIESFSSPKKAVSQGAQELRKALLAGGTASLCAAAAILPPWARGKTSQAQIRLAGQELRQTQVLNESQCAAVEASLGRTLTLWQGPPGTGKTRTLLQFLRVAGPVLGHGQILVSAASNVAVDNIVAGLLSLGVRVVRLGQPVKVLPELRASTLEAKLAQHPAGCAAALLREQAVRLSAAAARAAREQAMTLEEHATEDVLRVAEVVAATCIGAGDPRLASCSFRLCALDEATQATEPAALIPLLQRCESAVLVGDQHQLPPTVVSKQAERAGLGLSLFERLQQAGLRPMLLDTQYRMHPAIADFPSTAFYNGLVRSQPTPAERPAPLGFAWPNTAMPIAFMESDAPEERTVVGQEEATSYRNPGQAAVVRRIVQSLSHSTDLQGGLGDVGVLTPYSGQVRELQSLFSRTLTSELNRDLEVRSVDGFQGREKEVIVFSSVRSNAGHAVGFLADSRRLNVALTRARRGLIVVGCRSTLEADGTWRAWLAWIDKHQLAMKAT